MGQPPHRTLPPRAASTYSKRGPSVAGSQAEYLNPPGPSSDCRTRNNDYQHTLRKQSQSIQETTSRKAEISFQETPASILEHRRQIASPAVGGTVDRTTNVWYPSSFDEVGRWLEGHVKCALAAATSSPPSNAQKDRSSAINVLFIDEKKCSKIFDQDFALNGLLPKLKITGWCTSHYMTTYCRYPLPFDPDCDDEALQPVWGWRYSLSHPFDWDLLWAYFPHTGSTVAIIRTWFDGYDTFFTQLENEITNFEGPTLAHPMLFGLMALQILTSDAMGNVREKGNVIYEAQTWTGFHQYNRLRGIDSDSHTIAVDLGGVSRRVIGAASHITGWENATRQMAKFARFVQRENKRYVATGCAPGGEAERAMERLCVHIDEQAEKLIGDIDGAYHDSRAWLATANFLLMGVLNVLGQDDSRVNIELAKDQKRIAEETKRDSTSMTAIAVVTMFFLPGTFTSSFFAMPYFESDIEQHGWRHFWLYWAVTVPLTIVTLIVWICYTKFVSPTPSIESKLESDGDGDELDPKRRETFIMEWLAKVRNRTDNENEGVETA
ncbi:hypothetical protein VTK26DRAFT_6506 [Humicola hyalothermophila]